MPVSEEGITAVELDDPLVGTIFDKRFRIDERLAAGGFGAIYRATHVKSGHQFALKILHQKLASDLGVLARFRREGTTLSNLRNPHTISAYEYGQVERTLFIVLELLHGETLFDRYSMNGPIEWKRVVHMAKQVCESLAEAHAQGIIHRDLKPTNIHLEQHEDDPDFVKVLDFGIAKIMRGSEHDSQDITNAGQMIGTLDYMSPEQMVGGQVNGQTDIYTLGIVMYEMIAGTRPFPESENATAALAAMLKSTPEPLYLRAPVPKELDAVVMKCLERETQKRYRTVGEVRADLDRLVRDGVSATTATVMLPPKTFDDDNDNDDETAITPPPDRVLESMRLSQPARKTPAGEDTLRQPRVESPLAGARSAAAGRAEVNDVNTPRVEVKSSRELAVKTPRLERKTPSIEVKTPRVDLIDGATPRMERGNPPEWEDEDDRAPTTTRLPDGYDDGVPAGQVVRTPSGGVVSAPASRVPSGGVSARVPTVAGAGTAPRPGIPSTPLPRPLESRHVATPVPQIVVAPFSSTPRTPPPNDPRMRPPTGQVPVDPRARTPTGPPPPGGLPQFAPPPQTGVPQFASTAQGYASPPQPGQAVQPVSLSSTTVGLPPPPVSYGYLAQPPTSTPMGAPVFGQPQQPGGYDMSKLAARDAAMRRVVWIILLVLAGAAAFVIATQL